MKREFGSKLIEQVLPRLDLSHVVDTSGAYIPGHGTPTVILFGRHRAPVSDGVRTVMGIKGEPSTPDDPARGLVWSAIVGQIDRAGSESEFVSVADTGRDVFGKHPWSIGGGGAADLKESLESDRPALASIAQEVGITAVNGEDELFLLQDTAHVARVGVEHVRPMVTGDLVRDWSTGSTPAIWLYDENFNLLDLGALPRTARYFWTAYAVVSKRKRFGTPMVDRGLTWYEYQELYVSKLRSPLTITFGEIATHNHFVLDRGGKVFKQTAPVIKLPAGAGEDEHLGLLGLLNSSVGCFWLKQVCHNKGGGGINEGHRGDKWEFFYAFNSSKVADFPLVESMPVDITTCLDRQARQIADHSPTALLAGTGTAVPSRADLDAACQTVSRLHKLQIATQEELDWHCYRLYALLPSASDASAFEHPAPPEIALGERAFEIVLARRIAAGAETTTWFERHGSTPITEIPARWPDDYRQVVQRRIDLIGRDRSIALIERPEYKRRWNTSSWQSLEQAALRDWLLARLESPHYWPRPDGSGDATTPQLMSASRLADVAGHDAEFMHIAALYAGHADFDLNRLVADLVAAESVPFLPVLRYADTGLRKRAQWQATWALQRREDAIDAEVEAVEAPGWRAELVAEARTRFGLPDTAPLAADAQAWADRTLAAEVKRHQDERKAGEVGPIPVPPKYQSKDFLKADVWRLRGGLDVPKERWVSYPGCERGADASLPLAWAGWNHLQQATALAACYLEMKETEGWEAARLQPLLAGLLELVPWLKQWHNEVDPVFGERMGDYYAGFVGDEARALGFTPDDLRGWKPVAVAAKRGRRKAAT